MIAQIAAIDIINKSRAAWSDEPRKRQPVAYLTDGSREDITTSEYLALREKTTEADYREGFNYFAFTEPVARVAQ